MSMLWVEVVKRYHDALSLLYINGISMRKKVLSSYGKEEKIITIVIDNLVYQVF
jgi:hypothetical protein